MKQKVSTALFLLLISIVMLVVPVIPHHHHADGLICMKDDISETCCEHHTGNAEQHEHDHCCCDTGCITTHFYQQAPQEQQGFTVYPIADEYLYTAEAIVSLLLTEKDDGKPDGVFRESLHGICLAGATALRAPPSL